MKKKRLRKEHIPSFYFTRVPKRRSNIEELISFPVILEMKNGDIYAGAVDDYGDFRIIQIVIFACKKIVKREISDVEAYTEKIWEDYSDDGDFAYFLLKDIKNIYRAKDKSLILDEVLEISINPMRGLVKGIECGWAENGTHAENCDEDLHESLVKLLKIGHNNSKSEHEREELARSFNNIRRFIIENKGKIP